MAWFWINQQITDYIFMKLLFWLCGVFKAKLRTMNDTNNEISNKVSYVWVSLVIVGFLVKPSRMTAACDACRNISGWRLHSLLTSGHSPTLLGIVLTPPLPRKDPEQYLTRTSAAPDSDHYPPKEKDKDVHNLFQGHGTSFGVYWNWKVIDREIKIHAGVCV